MLAALLSALLVSPRPVTDERLKNPEPENWLQYRGNYASWGYSPLAQIHRQNVGRLEPVWTFSTGILDGHQSPPLVNDGVLYLTTPHGQVLALDARKGDLIWRYEEQNRVGDHIWWISDNSKFSAHYPEWQVAYDVPRILRDMHDANRERWT